MLWGGERRCGRQRALQSGRGPERPAQGAWRSPSGCTGSLAGREGAVLFLGVLTGSALPSRPSTPEVDGDECRKDNVSHQVCESIPPNTGKHLAYLIKFFLDVS